MAKQSNNKSYTTKVIKTDKPSTKAGQIPTSKNPPAPKPKK